MCKTREAAYGTLYPENAVPLKIVDLTNGQTSFEKELRWQRETFVPPGAIIGYDLVCHLEDVWSFDRWRGRFVITKRPDDLIN